MKMSIYLLSMLLAIIAPTLSHAKIAKSGNSNKISHIQKDLVHSFSQSEKMNLNDYLTEVTDDDINDAQRKNVLLQKGNLNSISFLAHSVNLWLFKTNWTTQYFFQLHSSLFIFLKVFRI
ncbi:MAG: hypothetical protein WCP61_09340 [Chitinophagia bacterium]|jgi:hypothetical protein